MNPLRVGSLFSGAGGLDMAVEQVFGARTVWHCELDPAASKVLAHRWPGVPNLRDITAVDWSAVEPVDILCGGWPCQPFSLAGKRRGVDDERALWPYVAGAVRALRPRIVVLENVAAVLRSPEFDRVANSLAACGYEFTWTCLRASDVGAPHRRERLFVVAHAGGDGFGGGAQRNGEAQRPELHASQRDDADRRHNGHGAVELLPTPNAQDGNGGGRFNSAGHQSTLPGTVRELLPTPRSSDCFGAGLHGDGGMDLRTTISELVKENSAAPEDRPSEVLRDMRSGVGAQEVCERATRGQECLPETPQLLSGMCELSNGSPAGLAPLASADPEGTEAVRGVRYVGQAEDSGVCWGKYAPAIARWEAVLGRPAPSPTEPNRNGNPRLSAAFSEFLMGWPTGHVTQVPGISRNDQLRIVGNGVVPQQGIAALRWLLSIKAAA